MPNFHKGVTLPNRGECESDNIKVTDRWGGSSCESFFLVSFLVKYEVEKNNLTKTPKSPNLRHLEKTKEPALDRVKVF